MANVQSLDEADQEAPVVLDPVWITMRDGTRLAARIWLPPEAAMNPVPAILEYLPYRRRDGTLGRDELTHAWLARNGYAGVRVDIRGNGDSDGFMEDEYSEAELDDGVQVIEWLARQPWCTGEVGMIGISWGGFNGLQIAQLAPPALKAAVTICFTDDRYADDIHYIGGCLLTENMLWSQQMLAYSSRPPDPAIVGEDWREIWRARLERQPLLIETWGKHQRRDAYWRRASVCEDYGAVKAAILAVGGWADAYSNAVPRVVAGLSAPVPSSSRVSSSSSTPSGVKMSRKPSATQSSQTVPWVLMADSHRRAAPHLRHCPRLGNDERGWSASRDCRTVGGRCREVPA